MFRNLQWRCNIVNGIIVQLISSIHAHYPCRKWLSFYWNLFKEHLERCTSLLHWFYCIFKPLLLCSFSESWIAVFRIVLPTLSSLKIVLLQEISLSKSCPFSSMSFSNISGNKNFGCQNGMRTGSNRELFFSSHPYSSSTNKSHASLSSKSFLYYLLRLTPVSSICTLLRFQKTY